MENEGIQAFGNGHILNFQDEDGQLLGLTYHDSLGEMFPYETDEISSEYAILGIASLHMRIREEKALLSLLTETFGFVEESRFVFEDKMVISLLFDNTFQHRVQVLVCIIQIYTLNLDLSHKELLINKNAFIPG